MVVLEDALLETREDAPSAPVSAEASAPTPVLPADTTPAAVPDAAEEKPLWARIAEWCRAHPKPSGYHEVRAAAAAVLPQLSRREAWLRVYVEVKRKAKVGSGRKPLFDFEPGNKQRFRLLEVGEAPGTRGAARRS